MYAYARHEFGDFAGYMTAWCYWITCWAGNAAIVGWEDWVSADAIRPSGFPNLDLVPSQRDLVGIEVEFVGESGWEGRLKGILATVADPKPFHGAYVVGRSVAEPDPRARDEALAERLWTESMKLVAL